MQEQILSGVWIDQDTVGLFDYDHIANRPFQRIYNSLGSYDEAPALRDLAAGLYILQGRFLVTGRGGSNDHGLNFVNPQMAQIVKVSDEIVEASFFRPNGLHRFRIEADSYTQQHLTLDDVKTTIDENASDTSVPTTLATKNAITNAFANVSVQPVYYYENLFQAAQDVNADSLKSKVSKDEAKVAVTRFGPGNYRLDLLDNITETEPITISCNIYLSLNGKTLSFDEPVTDATVSTTVAAITFSEGVYCVIDGEVSGSTVTKICCHDASIKTEYLIKSTANRLDIIGGFYSMQSSSPYPEKSMIFGVSGEKPNMSEWTDSEKLEWSKANKNSLPRLNVYGGSAEILGGGLVGVFFNTAAYVRCEGLVAEVSDVVSGRMIASGGCNYQEFIDCNFKLETKQADMVYVYYGSTGDNNTFVNSKMNMVVSTSEGDQMSEAICIKSNLTSAVIDGCKIDLYSGSAVQYVAAAITAGKSMVVRNSTINCSSKADINVTTIGVIFTSNVPKAEVLLENCTIQAHDAVQLKAVSGLSAENCILLGDRTGVFVESNPGDRLTHRIKDCVIKVRDDSKKALFCVQFSGDVVLDSCELDAGSADLLLSVLGNSTVSISNSTVKGDMKRVKLQEADSKLVIGSNVSLSLDDVDSTVGSVEVSNGIYRYLDPKTACSGKDLEVYFDYINGTIKSQLSSIIDGEAV